MSVLSVQNEAVLIALIMLEHEREYRAVKSVWQIVLIFFSKLLCNSD